MRNPGFKVKGGKKFRPTLSNKEVPRQEIGFTKRNEPRLNRKFVAPIVSPSDSVIFPASDVRLKQKADKKSDSNDIMNDKTIQNEEIEVNCSVSKGTNISAATGLKVFSLVSSLSNYQFTVKDRANIMKHVAGVTLINSSVKGDSLILGIDTEEDLNSFVIGLDQDQHWKLIPMDCTEKDPFAFFHSWTSLPCVDKNGMFQLIVSLHGEGSNGKRVESKMRSDLNKVIKNFNLARVVPGPGETSLMMGHVMEYIAYSKFLGRHFNTEKRHTWNTKKCPHQTISRTSNSALKYYWVEVTCPELWCLTPAHKQFSIFLELAKLGKVKQLEHELFGIPNNFLVVFDRAVEISAMSNKYCITEVSADALPEQYIPLYGVDENGFYSVNGTFPDRLSVYTRNKFVEDMKRLGAVGFRSGDSVSFSLHFLNSRCLDEIVKLRKYESFHFSIVSSVILKPGVDKKRMNLQPVVSIPDSKLVKKKIKGKASFGNDNVSQHNPQGMSQVPKDVRVSKPRKAPRPYGDVDGEKSIEQEKEKYEPNQDQVLLSLESLTKLKFKQYKSLAIYLEQLIDFFNKLPEVKVVGENSESTNFLFPSKKKLEDVMCHLNLDVTNSVEKLSQSHPMVHCIPSKIFNGKYGLILREKKCLKKVRKALVSSGIENFSVEHRIHSKVLWFECQTMYFKAFVSFSKYLLPPVHNFCWADSTVIRSASKPKLNVSCEDQSSLPGQVDAQLSIISVGDVESKLYDSEDFKNDQISLNESELFSCIWHKPPIGVYASDGQVISRQLTNFIKNVVCIDIVCNDDGLVINFENREQLEAALMKFCSSHNNKVEQLPALSRKFTLIPNRERLFGLHSTIKLKSSHFKKFEGCLVRHRRVMLPSKLMLVQVLRDKFISKTYSNLFIDFRNIFILRRNDRDVSSSNSHVTHSFPGSSSEITNIDLALKDDVGFQRKPNEGLGTDKNVVEVGLSPIPEKSESEDCCGDKNEDKETDLSAGALTQDSELKHLLQESTSPNELPTKESSVINNSEKLTNLEVCEAITPESESELLEELKSYSDDETEANMSNECSGVLTRSAIAQIDSKSNEFSVIKELNGSSISDSAILALSSTATSNNLISSPPPLLKKLLNTDAHMLYRSNLSLHNSCRKGFQFGKFGRVPTARMVRCGYKQCKAPNFSKITNFPDLFLDFKDFYRNTNFNDAANLIATIAHGNISEVTKISLKEIKMKRIESFLKTNLKVDTIGATGSSSAEKYSILRDNNAMDDSLFMKPESLEDELLCDSLGHYTLIFSSISPNDLSRVVDDVSWFDEPVSVNVREERKEVEFKFVDKSIAVAILNGLKQKYPGVLGISSGTFQDFIPDKDTGLYTLSFEDLKKMRYKATLIHFSKYCNEIPVISKGVEDDVIQLGFLLKKEAIDALVNNVDNTDFPKLKIASQCFGQKLSSNEL